MIAFVLSGGGSRGALQAGAIVALLDHGITPDLIIGTSVGAINGAALASLSGPERAHCIADRWRKVTTADIFPGNAAQVAWRLLSGQPSLYPNTALRRFVASILPPNMRRFKDLRLPLLVTATELTSGQLHLFGADPQDRLLESIMSSAAIPPYLPPWRYGEHYYTDGGVVANLPLSVALERGATEIYALEIGHLYSTAPAALSLRHTVSRSIQTMLTLQAQRERELAALARHEGVRIHHLELMHYSGLPQEDFGHGEPLLDLGYETALAFLQGRPLPSPVPPPNRPAPYRDLSRRLRGAASLRRPHPMALRPALSRLRRITTRDI